MSHKTVEFTPSKLKAFKKALSKAEAKAQGNARFAFSFEGNNYLVAYAKYLVEYLNPLMVGKSVSQRVETKA
jgi:hypothetical protein